MAKHTVSLPDYLVPKKRKSGYTVFYFQVPARLRPEGWPPTICCGRDDQDGIDAIRNKAKELKLKLDLERRDNQLQIVRGPAEGTFPDVIRKYRESEFWLTLKPATQVSYRKYIAKIESWSKAAQHPHVSTIQPRHIFAFLSKFSDRPRERKYLKAMLNILMNQALLYGYINNNFVKDLDLPQRRGRSKYKVIPWIDDDVKRFMAKADEMGLGSIGIAVLIGYDTGQRTTDIIGFVKPRDYSNGIFKHYQSKTGTYVGVPATKWLRSVLDELPDGPLCVCEATGRQWNATYFSHRFRDVANAAGMPEHLFKQLRHAHLQMLERAQCTEHERNAHSGHTRTSGNQLMDTSYGLERDEALAASAVEKLEKLRGASWMLR